MECRRASILHAHLAESLIDVLDVAELDGSKPRFDDLQVVCAAANLDNVRGIHLLSNDAKNVLHLQWGVLKLEMERAVQDVTPQ